MRLQLNVSFFTINTAEKVIATNKEVQKGW